MFAFNQQSTVKQVGPTSFSQHYSAIFILACSLKNWSPFYGKDRKDDTSDMVVKIVYVYMPGFLLGNDKVYLIIHYTLGKGFWLQLETALTQMRDRSMNSCKLLTLSTSWLLQQNGESSTH